MPLRPFQENAMRSIRHFYNFGSNRQLVVMPTGTGKTVLFAEVIKEFAFEIGERALVLAHREELLGQAADKIASAIPGVSVGIEMGSQKSGPMDDVVCAGIATVGKKGTKRLEWMEHLKPKVIIIDEAHHAAADSYQSLMYRMGCYEDASTLTLGLTATPNRLDNKPLHGWREGNKNPAIFQEVAYVYSMRDAIRDGWLCQIRGYRVTTDIDLDDVHSVAGDLSPGELERAVNREERNLAGLKAWMQHAKDRKTIVFCAGVAHAIEVAAMFKRHGVAAEAVYGNLPIQDRRGRLDRYRKGETQVLTNVEVLTEGFDDPATSCILHLRPTQSWSLYSQMTGRGTRLCKDKEDLVVIDTVDLTSKHNLATVPAMLGLPANLDLKGKTLEEAAAKLEKIGGAVSLYGFAAPRTIDEIDAIIERVDMMLESYAPSPLVESCSRMAWITLPDGNLILPCGSDTVDGSREARLTRDILGRWNLEFYGTKAGPIYRVTLGEQIAPAIRAADIAIEKMWPHASKMGDRSATWRLNPPSDLQVKHLRQNGVPPSKIEKMDRGQATAILQRLFLQSHRRGK